MKIIDYDKETLQEGETVIALGNFDGFHLGHQKLLEKAEYIAKEEGLLTAVLLFKSHTKSLLSDRKAGNKAYLSSLEDKLNYLEARAFDLAFIKSFNKDFAGLSPEDFIDRVLYKDLRVRHIVVGRDYHFGFKAGGSVDNLLKASLAGKFKLSLVDDVCYKGERISSSRIREDLLEGKLEEAGQMLGRPYSITGKVVHGKKRGHGLGYPTANMETNFSYILPRQGVYLSRVTLEGGTKYFAMSSIGSNPTFSNRPGVKIESNIFDFSKDIYGQEISLEFLHFHRPNRKFESPLALKSQLDEDSRDLKLLARTYPKKINK